MTLKCIDGMHDEKPVQRTNRPRHRAPWDEVVNYYRFCDVPPPPTLYPLPLPLPTQPPPPKNQSLWHELVLISLKFKYRPNTIEQNLSWPLLVQRYKSVVIILSDSGCYDLFYINIWVCDYHPFPPPQTLCPLPLPFPTQPPPPKNQSLWYELVLISLKFKYRPNTIEQNLSWPLLVQIYKSVVIILSVVVTIFFYIHLKIINDYLFYINIWGKNVK